MIKQKINFNYQGFSLSEVLLTLAIVGILAALTIPSLVQDTNKAEYYNRFKTAYTILDTATNAINAECNGNIKNNNCLTNPSAGDADATARTEVLALYRNKLKVSKFCGTATGCFATGFYKKLDGSNLEEYDNLNTFDTMILSNGVSIGVDWMGVSSPLGLGMFAIHVDVNGFNPPNKAGRDLFWFNYDPATGILEPRGSSKYPDDCITSGIGLGCSAKLIQDGGINY